MRTRFHHLLATLGLLLAAGAAAGQEPIAVISQYSPAAPAVSGGSLSLADVHNMLVGLNLAPYQMPGVDNMWLININRDGSKVPVVFTLSGDNTRIWIKSATLQVGSGMTPPWQKMVELQESIKPVMFSYRANSGELLVRYSIANHGVTTEQLCAAIDRFLDAMMSVRAAWDPSRWTTGNIAAPVPPSGTHTVNMPVAPAAVMKAVHDHLTRVSLSAEEFLADSDAFENGKPLSSEKIIRDLAMARQRINALLRELDNLPTSDDAETRDYVNAYRTFARTFMTTIDSTLIDCGQQMVSYLDNPRPGETRATVKAAMGELTGKAEKVILPTQNDFVAVEKHFRQHFSLVAAN